MKYAVRKVLNEIGNRQYGRTVDYYRRLAYSMTQIRNAACIHVSVDTIDETSTYFPATDRPCVLLCISRLRLAHTDSRPRPLPMVSKYIKRVGLSLHYYSALLPEAKVSVVFPFTHDPKIDATTIMTWVIKNEAPLYTCTKQAEANWFFNDEAAAC